MFPYRDVWEERYCTMARDKNRRVSAMLLGGDIYRTVPHKS